MRLAAKVIAALLALLLLIVGVLLAIAWKPMGKLPTDEAFAGFPKSGHKRDDRFVNPQLAWVDNDSASARGLEGEPTAAAEPDPPIRPVHRGKGALAKLPASGLRVTWLGHASTLVEIDGVRVLIDPLESARPSPLQFVGPPSWYASPIPIAALPPVDVVVISHDHYDHLDYEAVKALRDTKTIFVVPLGVGAHLRYWGVPAGHVIEIDWWQKSRVGKIEIVATPARHWSGRAIPGSDRALWAGYALIGDRHRAWYSGDTGYHDQIPEIGRRFGPFDVTLLDAGQYSRYWPDHHLGPEAAVAAHLAVRGKYLMPVHWGRVRLADHSWTEPVERVIAAADCANIPVLTPAPGASVEPDLRPALVRWWPRGPWQKAGERPIIPTINGQPTQRYTLTGCGKIARPLVENSPATRPRG
jgi:L-ascorbate metabolism protein UlaG (beta-lactamase superfamily)